MRGFVGTVDPEPMQRTGAGVVDQHRLVELIETVWLMVEESRFHDAHIIRKETERRPAADQLHRVGIRQPIATRMGARNRGMEAPMCFVRFSLPCALRDPDKQGRGRSCFSPLNEIRCEAYRVACVIGSSGLEASSGTIHN